MQHPKFCTSVLIATIGMTACRASAVPPKSAMEVAQFFPQYNSQRVKIRYGPFTTDPMDVDNGMADFVETEVTKPCTDCTVTFMQAGLEYEDGTIADASTGYWLHHTVIFNQDKLPPVCPYPHQVDKIFASGNERTPVDISASGIYEAGYYLGPNDSIGMSTELMNMATVPQTAYVTVTWEYITRPPASFSNVKVLWLDIGGCNGSSEQPPKSTTDIFEYISPQWVSDISGKITFIGGHLHDGGTHLNVIKNSISQCDCRATYGPSPKYISGDVEVSGSMMNENSHISTISVCSHLDSVLVEPGDIWTIDAHYDPTEHDLMMNMDGTPEPIMGIALVYVADKDVISQVPLSSHPASKGRFSFWPVGVLLVAVSVLIYIIRSKKREKHGIGSEGYKLLPANES